MTTSVKPRRRGRRRSTFALLIAGVAAVVAPLLIAPTAANASTSPVSYLDGGAYCEHDSGSSSYIELSYPTSVAHYVGTDAVYWVAEVDVLNTSNQWVFSSYVDPASTSSFYASGTTLTPNWGYATPNAIHVRNGQVWRIVGWTYWHNSSGWFYNWPTVLGSCNFR